MRKSIRTGTLGVVLALAVLGMPSISLADPFSVGDGWHQFSWKGAPTATQAESAFTFTSAGAVTVKVTDAYVLGDRFQLYDKGSLVGQTSQTNGSPQPWTDNPNVAFAGLFSKGTFTLGAGTHSLILKTFQTPFGFDSGAGFLRFDAADNGGGLGIASASVPEPGTLALVGMGFASLVVGRFRRRFRNRSEAVIV